MTSMISTAASIVLRRLINFVYALSLLQSCSSYVVKLHRIAALSFMSFFHLYIIVFFLFNVENPP